MKRPITKKEDIRAKVDELFEYEEYIRVGHKDGVIGMTSEHIPPSDISGLMNSFFNNLHFAEAKSAVIVTVTTDTGVYYSEIPSADSIEIAKDTNASDTPFNENEITDTTTPYDFSTHGAPNSTGVVVTSYNLPSKGDFFSNLNLFALLAAASAEVSKDYAETIIDERVNIAIEELKNYVESADSSLRSSINTHTH